MKNVLASTYCLFWEQIGIEDIPRVGGKNAALGEMVRHLKSAGVKIPEGFALTVDAYRRHLEVNDLIQPISIALQGLDVSKLNDLAKRARQIRDLIQNAELPADVEISLMAAYDHLCELIGPEGDVAVRSSATAEDLPEASFAGQQETYLHIRGHKSLSFAVRSCFASLFTERAITYRENLGFDHLPDTPAGVGLSVGVQRMIRSDLACSGVAFTLDTETGFRDAVLINASYGLGETIVKGSVNPDEFMVFKPTLKKGFSPIIKRKIGSKKIKMIYTDPNERSSQIHLLTKAEPEKSPSTPSDSILNPATQTVSVSMTDQRSSSLQEHEILQISKWAVAIEEHYSQKADRLVPMDIEWAKDGRSGELFILQARPETVHARNDPNRAVLETYCFRTQPPQPILEGQSVGTKIARGQVRVLTDLEHLEDLRSGEILVTERTDPDWEPVMRKAAAVITNRGGRTCHAAIVSRELGLAAVVGTENATERLATGQEITVSCAQGDTGYIYSGLLDFDVEKTEIAKIPAPPVKIMINLADPAEALRLSFLPSSGVGLLRVEFLINHHIGIHPMALVHFEQVTSPADRDAIEERTFGYQVKSDFFIQSLAEGVGLIAAAFYPRTVVLRFSDFKTNEYAHLLGGATFESTEQNPMLGFRGASRYTHPLYREAFALECAAVRQVRDKMGLTNLKIMIPFCRTVFEAQKVLYELNQNGLRRGENDLEVLMMCEVPSNAILAHEFASLFDGFSIGSNDLTQLLLGVDRESEILATLFNENDPAVRAMISQVIQAAHENSIPVGICGQAPSDDLDFARFLIHEGIDSLSLNPDAVLKTIVKLHQRPFSRKPPERTVTH